MGRGREGGWRRRSGCGGAPPGKTQLLLLTATWPEADEPEWRFPAATPRLSRVGGARGPRRRRGVRGLGGVHGVRPEDDITLPFPHCFRPQPGPWLGKEASCCGVHADTGAQGQLPVTAVGGLLSGLSVCQVRMCEQNLPLSRCRTLSFSAALPPTQATATGYISFQFKIVTGSLILVGEECNAS